MFQFVYKMLSYILQDHAVLQNYGVLQEERLDINLPPRPCSVDRDDVLNDQVADQFSAIQDMVFHVNWSKSHVYFETSSHNKCLLSELGYTCNLISSSSDQVILIRARGKEQMEKIPLLQDQMTSAIKAVVLFKRFNMDPVTSQFIGNREDPNTKLHQQLGMVYHFLANFCSDREGNSFNQSVYDILLQAKKLIIEQIEDRLQLQGVQQSHDNEYDTIPNEAIVELYDNPRKLLSAIAVRNNMIAFILHIMKIRHLFMVTRDQDVSVALNSIIKVINHWNIILKFKTLHIDQLDVLIDDVKDQDILDDLCIHRWTVDFYSHASYSLTDFYKSSSNHELLGYVKVADLLFGLWTQLTMKQLNIENDLSSSITKTFLLKLIKRCIKIQLMALSSMKYHEAYATLIRESHRIRLEIVSAKMAQWIELLFHLYESKQLHSYKLNTIQGNLLNLEHSLFWFEKRIEAALIILACDPGHYRFGSKLHPFSLVFIEKCLEQFVKLEWIITYGTTHGTDGLMTLYSSLSKSDTIQVDEKRFVEWLCEDDSAQLLVHQQKDGDRERVSQVFKDVVRTIEAERRKAYAVFLEEEEASVRAETYGKKLSSKSVLSLFCDNFEAL
jgi:hypothetical protein